MTNQMVLQAPLQAIPDAIASASDYEAFASQFIAAPALAYIAGGSGEEVTLHRNRESLSALALQHRLLRSFDHANTATQLLGRELKHPILLGPVAHQKLVHPQGECATVMGAEVMDTPFVTSTLAHSSLEDVATAARNPKWFQLYFQPDKQITLDLVRRAESAGYEAIVVTADVPVNGLRFRAQRSGFVMPNQLREENLASYSFPNPHQLDRDQSIVFDGLMVDAPTWQDIKWLRKQTELPILLKGISNPDDAQLAQQSGLNGVVVSNHGGRSLDGLPASIDCLPVIRRAVGDDFPVLVDSGFRSGGDIFKALALGADAVMIGRLQVYALAIAGALGVAHMLRCLCHELDVTMALSGCCTITDITPEAILYSNT